MRAADNAALTGCGRDRRVSLSDRTDRPRHEKFRGEAGEGGGKSASEGAFGREGVGADGIS
jgi:hypothetical protein